MKAATTLLTLLSLSISSLAAPDAGDHDSAGVHSADGNLHQHHESVHAVCGELGESQDRRPDVHVPAAHGQGQLRRRLFSYGKQLNTTLASGSLVLGGSGSKAFIVEPKDRARFREVAFKENPKTPATYNARYACINGKPGAHVVLVPAESDQGLTFCVYPDSNKGGQYGLWVKAADDSSPDCVAITAVVNEVV
ncbi:hypothetical protein FN846DRAFT_906952 [Sphaerosporella brunnea]|uniref:Uncharacterized protein n=1 Tax=Sphaerosporella brunnea TaxID=1250544 RepID=A0A5J5EXR0_9PEZI|nr:hypothetical protein FN846DRAFT_906952 [Sphaerosporella brunnea]